MGFGFRTKLNLESFTVDRHFSAVTFFSRLGDFSQIADWYFRGWRAQTTRKFLFCSITSITCSKSRSWYFRGLDANRENRENVVNAEKWPCKVCYFATLSHVPKKVIFWQHFCLHRLQHNLLFRYLTSMRCQTMIIRFRMIFHICSQRKSPLEVSVRG